MTTADNTSMVGALLGDTYRITKLLGAGGMGEVYLAEHQRLPRPFAVKVLHESVHSETEAYRRFRREAEVCARLRHPNIVEVVDFNVTADGKPYLVMEYLEGEDLSQRIARVGRLSLEKTLDILGQVSDALAMTHADGIVHRDLKPQNIFLSPRPGGGDWVKLLDFGISKIQGSDSMLTGAGSMMGTPYYMSPEQAGGGSATVTGQTDIFALGVITYESLTGKLPFVGDTLPKIIFQICFQEPPSVTSKVPGLPHGVEAVIRRALAKESTERYPTVTAFMEDFRRKAAGVADETATAAPVTDGFASTAMTPSAVAVPTVAAASAATAQTMAAGLEAGLEATIRPQQTTMSGAAVEVGAHSAHANSGWWGKATRRVAIVALATIALGGLILYWVTQGPSQGPSRPNKPSASTQLPGSMPAQEPDTPASEMRPTVPLAALVTIAVRGLPPRAECQINGRKLADNPIVLPRSDQPVALVCEAPGFKTFSAALLPTIDRTITVDMPDNGQPRTIASTGMAAVKIRPNAPRGRPPNRPSPMKIAPPPPRPEGVSRPRPMEDDLF